MMHSIRGLAAVLLAVADLPEPVQAQADIELSRADRTRIEEASRLVRALPERLWPGWGGTPFDLLLVTESAELFVGSRAPGASFSRRPADPTLGPELWIRPLSLPPNILATFPVGGAPTIVVGTAERTGKSSTAWVLTLMHEHFHQWQYSLPDYYAAVSRLGLARGDTTGGWMLDYPFPYDSAPVQQAMGEVARALGRALALPLAARSGAIADVVARRDTLRARLGPSDERYFEFQLWQEGVARFIELAAARAAAGTGEPPAAFRTLPDHEPYRRAADSALSGLRRSLDRLDLGSQRRVAFYAIGAAMALLLDEAGTDWKDAYLRRPFRLSDLLPDAR